MSFLVKNFSCNDVQFARLEILEWKEWLGDEIAGWIARKKSSKPASLELLWQTFSGRYPLVDGSIFQTDVSASYTNKTGLGCFEMAENRVDRNLPKLHEIPSILNIRIFMKFLLKNFRIWKQIKRRTR